jgi:hypothetical protein
MKVRGSQRAEEGSTSLLLSFSSHMALSLSIRGLELKRSREPAGVCSPEVGQAREGEGIVEE